MDLETWLNERIRLAEEDLEFREIRKGVQAIHADYLGRLSGRELGKRALDGRGKRAAFATFYAAIHHATVQEWLVREPAFMRIPPKRIVDLGCGTGAVGTAVARSLGETSPELLGLDCSTWAVAETRSTYQLFGLQGQSRRATLPGGMPRTGAGDLIVAGWSINELKDDARNGLLGELERAIKRGAYLLIFEPISQKICPWWSGWTRTLAPYGGRDSFEKFNWERPEWIRKMDKAAKMNHHILSARILNVALDRKA